MRLWWREHGFIIMVILSILFIAIMFIFKRNQPGSWGDWGSWQLWDVPTDYKPVANTRPKDSKGEVECRRVLEKIFNKPFPKVRPSILNNSVTSSLSSSLSRTSTDNYNLELDCYNSDLQLACEYNGIQHYQYTPFFHRNKEAFLNQKYRDHIKRDLCQKNGIYLIEVPYSVPLTQIELYITKQLSAYLNKLSNKR
jgi:hypothetical protein